jgi:hypothetical protein
MSLKENGMSNSTAVDMRVAGRQRNDAGRGLKRTIKRLLIKALQPPVRGSADFFQRLLMAGDDSEERERAARPFTSTLDYLNYWQRRITREVSAELGAARLSGVAAGRPHYVWGTLNGAYLAHALGIPRISVMEFGVAGGNGLVALEVIAAKVSGYLGVGIDVYGFDTGIGNPKPEDYRDVPNLFQEGDYPMDVARLQSRLTSAKLMLGPVETTVGKFLASRPAPIAFASFDFGIYSATRKALALFEGDERTLLPRIQCYFVGAAGLTFSEFAADRLAISEFNAAHALRKLSPVTSSITSCTACTTG